MTEKYCAGKVPNSARRPRDLPLCEIDIGVIMNQPWIISFDEALNCLESSGGASQLIDKKNRGSWLKITRGRLNDLCIIYWKLCASWVVLL